MAKLANAPGNHPVGNSYPLLVRIQPAAFLNETNHAHKIQGWNMSLAAPSHKDKMIWERNSGARAARNETELVGTLNTVRFYDKDSGAFIGQLCDGSNIKGDIEEGELERGMAYRFLGEWGNHHRFGLQFNFRSFVAHIPATRQGVERYLCIYARHVGVITAEKLYQLYGDNAVEVLRTDPARVAGDAVMNEQQAEEASRDLAAEAGMEATKLELYGLFDGRGFPRRLIKDVIQKWGVKSVGRIKRNPFSLMLNNLSGCGFKRCDKLYLDLGHKPGALKRQMLCAWNAIREDSQGSTWFDRKSVVRAIRGAVGYSVARPDDAIKLGVRAEWLAEMASQGDWIAEAGNAKAERDLASKILGLIQHDADSLERS